MYIFLNLLSINPLWQKKVFTKTILEIRNFFSFFKLLVKPMMIALKLCTQNIRLIQ